MNNNLTSYIITTRNIRCWYKRYKYTLLTCRLRNKTINILEEKKNLLPLEIYIIKLEKTFKFYS